MSNLKRSVKRPFQPPVDSYFEHVDEETRSLATAAQQRSSLKPTLPVAIQSSLLNVGMRVRKSVPEGYKNQAKPVVRSSISSGDHDDVNRQCSRRGIVRRPIELMPYCGILHVGGLEASSTLISDAEGLAVLPSNSRDNESPPSPGFAAPPSAYIDFDSFSPASNSKKRSRDDLDDAAAAAAFQPDTCALESLAPLARVEFDSFPPGSDKERPLDDSDDDSDFRPDASSPLRPILRQISRRRSSDLNRRRPQAQPKSMTMRNRGAGGAESEMVDADDFEEATFLEPENWAGRHYG